MFWNNKNYVNNLNKIFYTCKNKPFIFFRYIGLVYEKSLYLWFQSYSFFRNVDIYLFYRLYYSGKTKYLPKCLTERISLHLTKLLQI